MKKLFSIFFILILMTSCSIAVGSNRCENILDKMVICKFIRGTEKGLELDKELTRAEAAVLCNRIAGGEIQARSKTYIHPFTDVPEWAQSDIAYLYQLGLINGISENQFGSNQTLTAQQFYAMLLRCLGYSEKNGDYTYKNTLSFAQSINLLTEEEKELISSHFNRDAAVIAMYHTLLTPKKGDSIPLCKRVSEEINASYSPTCASIISGECEVYNILNSTLEAMNKLDSYVMTQQGSYHTKNTDSGLKAEENYLCTVYSYLNKNSAIYEAFMKTHSASKNSCIETTFYSTPETIIQRSNAYGSYFTEVLPQTNNDIANSYAAVHKLFSPDLQFAHSFDQIESEDYYILQGYSNRYCFIYDITSQESTDYYYDMQIFIGKDTNYLHKIEIDYQDQWQISENKTIEVDYKIVFKFDQYNKLNSLPSIDEVFSK